MATKKASGKIKITLTKSLNSCTKKQIDNAKALGLHKINASNVVPNDATTLGKVNVIRHLVVIEEE